MERHSSNSTLQIPVPCPSASIKRESIEPPAPEFHSLHDIVVDYVTSQAYSSTAKALSRGPQRHEIASVSSYGCTSGENSGATSLGNNNGEHMDIDHSCGSNGVIDGRSDNLPVIDEDTLTSIERRRVIIDHILNGVIQSAIEALNENFPSVLAEVESGISAANGSAAGGDWTPKARSVDNSATKTEAVASNHTVPVMNHSVLPAHVRLNLLIQQFVESFRQLNPASAPSSPSSSISSLNHSQTSGGPSGSSLTHALTAAHGLHSEAKKLAPEVRAVYLQEIKDVGALFAYESVETSPLKGFLEQGRRIRLADQVNMAILRSQGKPGQSRMEEYARRTEVIYKIMQGNQIEATAEDEPLNHQLANYWVHQSFRPYNFHDFACTPW